MLNWQDDLSEHKKSELKEWVKKNTTCTCGDDAIHPCPTVPGFEDNLFGPYSCSKCGGVAYYFE